jgi:hypothetical protein
MTARVLNKVFGQIQFMILRWIANHISYQVVKQNGVDRFINGVRIVSANRFLAALI